jgi:hypothetical protein
MSRAEKGRRGRASSVPKVESVLNAVDDGVICGKEQMFVRMGRQVNKGEVVESKMNLHPLELEVASPSHPWTLSLVPPKSEINTTGWDST